MYQPEALETYTVIEVQFPPEQYKIYTQEEEFTGLYLLSLATLFLLGALFLWQLSKKDKS